ncbi:MAG TPA: tRNA guanosine(15) transglycosylase TgtA [Nitrososphaerales archaeon]|jgi:7-cyano-7-deazaguanine tRNA-ribosyltransferase|nr:tRNA guanosine(15) transglycosylase TgtA [Nitrososphaerales archaeon]
MFEVKSTDLAGRIGRLTTKSGTIETPALLPVIHPSRQTLPAETIKNLGFQAVITNAYIAKKNCSNVSRKKGIHKTIGFDGIVMTDSGGYQVLEYGDVNASPESMTIFQEEINSDMAVVLDQPTGARISRKYAEKTVNETLKAAKKTLETRSKKNILWVGPIQGGIHLDLVSQSALEISQMDFDILALGSPTEIMKSYQFKLLSDMIISAKKNIPVNMPLHLFGAGHPLTIPLAISLGCDLFDSASYMLYAREDRYFTDSGTVRIKDLSYLNCSCPFCSSHSLEDLVEKEKEERIDVIALHNLHVLMKTVKESKEAIREGRLWEYLGSKARCHPRLWEAFKSLSEHIEYLEDGSRLYKSRAVFFTEPIDYVRPEVTHHRTRLEHNIEFSKPILLLLPEVEIRPFYNSPLYLSISKVLMQRNKKVQVCFIIPTLGVIPLEISDIYPLSQYESSFKPDTCPDISQAINEDVERIINSKSIIEIIILVDGVFSRNLAEKIQSWKTISIVKTENDDFQKTIQKLIERLLMIDP